MIGFGLAINQPQGGGLEGAIRALFANGEQGAVYDPSDFSSLYQDSQGITPVTAVEQPVGLMLDKRLGLARGAELAPPSLQDWQLYGSPTSVVGNTITTSASGQGVRLPVVLEVGRVYELISSGSSTVSFTWQQEGGAIVYRADHGRAVFRAVSTLLILRSSGAGTITVDSITVKAIGSGVTYPAFQATAASRPVLSARMNMLDSSEDLTTSWTSAGATATANTTIAPNGTLTADTLSSGVNTGAVRIHRNPTLAVSSAVKLVGHFKKGTAHGALSYSNGGGLNVTYAKFDLDTGVATVGGVGSPVATMVAVDNGFYRCELSFTNGVANGWVGVHIWTPGAADSFNYPGTNADETVIAWGFDFRFASVGVAPVYQRVTSSTDYETVGFPHYLRCDGIDDGMATAAIDFTGTDKMTVWVGVRKLSDAAVGTGLELGTSGDGQDTLLMAPRHVAGNYGADLRQGGLATTVTLVAASPVTSLLTGSYDRGALTQATQISFRLNGATVANSASGTGPIANANFVSNVLYLFRRAGTTLPFTGHFYGAIIRGAASTAAQVATGEQYIGNKTGVTLP